MDIITATPVEIDTELARTWGASDSAHAALSGVMRKIRQFEESVYAPEVPQELIVKRDELRELIGALQDEARPLKDEYNRRPWARYYRVDNSNGHVHTSTACQYTYSTTVFGWLPQVSGATAEEIVEMAGAMTCLGCFPTVRAEIVADRPCRLETANQRKTREDREAAAALKAERDAKKAAKAIANPDGSPLRIENHYCAITTLHTAQSVYTDTAAMMKLWEARAEKIALARAADNWIDPEWADRVYRNLAEHEADCFTLLTALAHKLGTTVEEERAGREKKAQARYKRDWEEA